MSLHFPGHPEAAAPAGYRLVLAPCSLVLLVFHGFGARPDVGFRRHHHYIIYAVHAMSPPVPAEKNLRRLPAALPLLGGPPQLLVLQDNTRGERVIRRPGTGSLIENTI